MVEETAERVRQNPRDEKMMSRLREMMEIQKYIEDTTDWAFDTKTVLAICGTFLFPLILQIMQIK